MSDQDSTEEKKHQPSHRKLRKLRERGQVPHSADFVTFIIFLVVSLTIIFTIKIYIADLNALFLFTQVEISENITRSLPAIWLLIFKLLLIILVPTFFGAILANIIHKKGFVFSFENISPKFNRLNPVAGLKKIFGFRGFVEFFIALVKLIIWLSVTLILLYHSLEIINAVVQCEPSCSLEVFFNRFSLFYILGVIFLFIAALFDLKIQPVLFNREQKMTDSEMKRDRKDTDGNPEIKGERKRIHREIVEGEENRPNNQPGSKGSDIQPGEMVQNRSEMGTQTSTQANASSNAEKNKASGGQAFGKINPVQRQQYKDSKTVEPKLIISGANLAVGIYVNTTTVPIPTIILAEQGYRANSVVEMAQSKKIIVEYDATLAKELYNIGINSQIPPHLFEKIARIFKTNHIEI